MTWTPLFSGIVMSSLWEEPLGVRVLFTTMLAIRDRDGFVRGSVGSLRRVANLTEGQVEEALKVLEAPDGKSANGEHEGRRVLRVEGGWQLTGHGKYLDLMKGGEAVREANRERQRRHRKKAMMNTCRLGMPLAGEKEYVDALEAGRPQEDLDRIVEKWLPKTVGGGAA
jgi:hypothetical protein